MAYRLVVPRSTFRVDAWDACGICRAVWGRLTALFLVLLCRGAAFADGVALRQHVNFYALRRGPVARDTVREGAGDPHEVRRGTCSICKSCSYSTSVRLSANSRIARHATSASCRRFFGSSFAHKLLSRCHGALEVRVLHRTLGDEIHRAAKPKSLSRATLCWRHRSTRASRRFSIKASISAVCQLNMSTSNSRCFKSSHTESRTDSACRTASCTASSVASGPLPGYRASTAQSDSAAKSGCFSRVVQPSGNRLRSRSRSCMKGKSVCRKIKMAFSAFSAACCASQHACLGAKSEVVAECEAARKSSLAYRSHRRVSALASSFTGRLQIFGRAPSLLEVLDAARYQPGPHAALSPLAW